MVGTLAILAGMACVAGGSACGAAEQVPLWRTKGAVRLSQAAGAGHAVGPGGVIVHSQFGGQIFGFDIDQSGTEGVLSESVPMGPNDLAAVETFDQASGKIVKVVKKIEGRDDYVTQGVLGGGIGLVEREHVRNNYVSKRIYNELNPLGANAFTGVWSSMLKADDIVLSVSRNQPAPSNAFLVYHNSRAGATFVVGANVAAGTQGTRVYLKAAEFGICCVAEVGYDATTNQAVVAGSTGEVGGPPPLFALADLGTGKVVTFSGLQGPPPFGAGFVNGLAVDSDDGIACTTTELDSRVEFYDLKTQIGFSVTLPNSPQQINSGSDVEYDPLHKLFFVAQSVSTTGSGSSLQVYDLHGNLVESLNGFNFSNSSNVIGTHIALNPAARSGFVDGPAGNVSELQSFTY